MDIHKNVRLTPHSRVELVRRVLVEGQSKTKVAASLVTASKRVNLSVWPPAQNEALFLILRIPPNRRARLWGRVCGQRPRRRHAPYA